MEQIHNRYRIIGEKIPNQLEALRRDLRFCKFCEGLYARAYKDWMILAIIYNVVLNLKLREQGVDYLNSEEAVCAMRAVASTTVDDVFATEHFIGNEFDRCLVAFHSTVLTTWGFHPRLQMVKPDVIEAFLRKRMRHFDFDLPHNPFFTDPPGDFPVWAH